ncbi:MAG: hypothetical protein FRX48_06004 [Lasallia pustulata]|uniref:AAA+ ATPase domain-containing protein n=1 Tax=Lasallia pustulata TaxID=136370 RepID=A0A5M8PPX6_9LECA|nr:MAG: hypothetical protein FRX48_06004 [Lasallia pustulata]
MSAESNGVCPPNTADVHSSERRYIELLERRIADLEKLVISSPSAPAPGETQSAAEAPGAKSKDTVSNGAKKDGEPVKSASRVHNVLSKWDPKECRRIDRDASEIDNTAKKEAHAFIFRKTQDEKDKFLYSEVEIKSADLKKVLQDNLRHYPGHFWDGDVVTIVDPFAPIVHNWDTLQKVAHEEGSELSDDEKLARSDLKLLLGIISTASGVDRLGKYFKDREQHIKNKTITYDTLWTLFPPGELVYSEPFLNREQIFIVGSSYVDFPREERRAKPWSVICLGYDWNGETFNRKAYEFEFEKFLGSKTINALPSYPLRHYKKGDQEQIRLLKSKLLKRGRAFKDLATAERGRQMFRYQGKALYRGIGISTIDSATQVTQVNDDDDRSYITATQEELGEATRRKLTKLMTCDVKEGGTVMIDFLSYFQYADKVARLGDLKPTSDDDDECGCPTCRGNKELSDLLKFNFDEQKKEDDFEDLQYMICPPRVLGYVIERKMWAQLQVDEVKDVKNENASDTFDNKLQLEDDTKDIIKNLVTSHEQGKEEKNGKRTKGIQDFVQGKGDGLVILLHGPPGVGKTLTAESVALRANKPLFAVGVTDVGVDPEKVQINLERMFDLAATWEAVLLIDEADVFLDSRASKGQTDLRRNALVSVLLRVLEYYQGILILTTNRIRDFDVAVQSRIHLAIKYEDLSREQQIAIFTTFLSQARDKGNVEDWRTIEKWVAKDATSNQCKFNGRQIRNIVTSAMGLARAGDRKLQKDDLAQVARMTKDFKHETSVQEQLYRANQIDFK